MFLLILSIIYSTFAFGNTTDDMDSKLDLVHDSFLYQRSLFKNVNFKAYYIQPYSHIEPTQEGELLNIVYESGKKRIIEQQYQLNKNGNFLCTINRYISTGGSDDWQKESGGIRTSFNGEIIESRGAQHIEDVLNLAPNVNVSSGASRGQFFQIRFL